MDRILDGSPWNVRNKVVLIQKFDPNLRPTDVKFDRMAVWIRIYNLPFGLMNKKWGMELAGKVGMDVKVEVDAQDRAWGLYLRARVMIDVSNPSVVLCQSFLLRGKPKSGMMYAMRKSPTTATLVGSLVTHP